MTRQLQVSNCLMNMPKDNCRIGISNKEESQGFQQRLKIAVDISKKNRIPKLCFPN